MPSRTIKLNERTKHQIEYAKAQEQADQKEIIRLVKQEKERKEGLARGQAEHLALWHKFIMATILLICGATILHFTGLAKAVIVLLPIVLFLKAAFSGGKKKKK